ncbi:hypothetical protein [Streptomyces sp. 769]|uniref:hypothetical protein n=1 Tax=Streptomyces sp. 769 TaxID=1262452 RepID=UPI00057C782B|nr:hypothetical protein [Streptomyces sp. 769]
MVRAPGKWDQTIYHHTHLTPRKANAPPDRPSPPGPPTPQASHSTCGDTGEDSEETPAPDSDACAASDDFWENFGGACGTSGDGPDAWTPPLGDAEPPDGPLGGALGEPEPGALGGDDGRPGRDGEGCAGPDGPSVPGVPPWAGPGCGPDGRAGGGVFDTEADADGTALGDAPASPSRPVPASPPAGLAGPPWPVRREPLPRPSAVDPPGRAAFPFPSPGRATLPDGAGCPGSLTLMQPASEAASAETVTAATANRALARTGGGGAGALAVVGSVSDDGRGGIGCTGGTSGSGAQGRRRRPAQLPPPA